jgi:hypothetical protein
LTTTYSCPEEDIQCQVWQISSYAITHERAVPTSASCLMRPTMACVCTRHSLVSEDVHTLCYAECPLMYVLRVPVEMSAYRTGSVECDHSPRQRPTSNSTVHLVYIRVVLSHNNASPTECLNQVTNQLVEEKEMDWGF